MSEIDEVVREFLVESHENLDSLDRDLVTLEKEPGNRDLLARVFRAIHTIKGTSGFLAFSKLEHVAHEGESLLSQLRDGTRPLTPDVSAVLLATVDAIRSMMTEIESSGADGENEYGDLVDWLRRIRDDPQATMAPVPKKPAVKPAPAPPTSTAQAQAPAPPPAAPAPTATTEAARPAGPAEAGDGRSAAESTIRVDVVHIDQLLSLVGELVLARNQIVQHAAGLHESQLVAASQRLNLLTTKLQEGVMKTRMQPIGSLWSKLPRVVRDLSVACGKKVRLETEGQDTELDKALLEAIKDPLTHMVRNSVDHGLETPEERRAAGKPDEGVLRLRAYHEGGQVTIEIRDDGRGIDPERIRRKAVDSGMLTAEAAAALGERDTLELVFRPGFSTAKQVTNVSGRGVGMDVVKTNIERIGGNVSISSTVGAGTTVRVAIPLTLAIIQALLVSVRGCRLAVPQASLLELVRIHEGAETPRVERIGSALVLRLRGRLLPVVDVGTLLGLEAAGRDAARYVVVVQAGGALLGLLVDGVQDAQELVVKPLGAHFKGISAFAGAAILGDGAIALIVDVLRLARDYRGTGTEPEAGPVEDAGATRRRSYLLVDSAGGERYALPLSAVARLADVPAGKVERARGRPHLQDAGSILPLRPLEELLGDGTAGIPAEGELSIVVADTREGRVGIVVRAILDVVEDDLADDSAGDRSVIDGRVTTRLDLGTAPAPVAGGAS